MPEIIIRYRDKKPLHALLDFAKYFKFSIVHEATTKTIKPKIPVVFASKPELTALSGIWKDKERSIEKLREEAWGDRICAW